MNNTDCPPRLAVVAAIIDGSQAGRGPLVSGARLGSEIRDKARSATAATATPAEHALAQALRDDGSTDHAIADLLLLADDGPVAGRLAIGLSEEFLLPKSPLVREERRSAFADLYRRLVLHQLNSQVRNKAAATLCVLRREATT